MEYLLDGTGYNKGNYIDILNGHKQLQRRIDVDVNKE